MGYGHWYVFNRRAEVGKPVGMTWQRTESWVHHARAEGYTVNKTPAKWSVAARGKLIGFVESVEADGSFTFTAMNYLAGFLRTDTVTVSAAEADAYLFIH